MTPYRARRYETEAPEPAEPAAPDEPDNDVDPADLPGRHTALDALALEQGHTWSSDDLTVAQKRDELAGQ